METKILGNTNISVTALGYGAMELRLLNSASDAERVLNAVLDNGITYIDTSPDYGLSETYIGQAIAHRRDEYTLASKCGCNVDENGKSFDPPHVWNAVQLQKNIENSLRLLKTDVIDVWQLHGMCPDDLDDGKYDDVIKTMQRLKQQGKIRAVGMSFRNGGPGQELYPAGYGFRDIHAFLEWEVFDVMQIVYGGLTRMNEAVIAEAAERGLGMIIRGVVKKYADNYDQLFEQAKLPELCEPGESAQDFLIRFALAHPGIGTMIIGSQNPDHIAANAKAAAQGKLADNIYTEAKQRLDAAGIVVKIS